MANLQIIRDLCEQKGITLRKLAAAVGRNESSLQAMIRKGSTNTGTLEAIARELEVPISVFYGSPDWLTGAAEKTRNAPMSQGNKSGINDVASGRGIANGQDENLAEVIREKDRQIEKLLSLVEKLTNK